ncbi:fumarate hydratase [Anaerotruncus massiliensis (ex Togo et al. 2019)]|uniref:fumarate hydratase n=1 Tax=Anaerotruncus TaxID=244127 RepID=UPI000C78E6EC|nr:fumarate hydratase [Anaerotruncus massiliensis (ex Togo et al. 2019)]GKH46596.1 fumarate hydratase [Oscillospiraceae bacterium]
MREIPREAVVEAVKALCIEANRMLPADLKERLCGACRAEESPLGREVLSDIVRNYETAEALSIPVCQDTGMAVVFAELGEDAHVPGLEEAVNEGVRRGYTEGLLRCSVVGDPLRRQNTGDNTPAVLHLRLVPGDRLTLTVAPKGAGSENMSSIRMMTPAASEQDLIDAVVRAVEAAGSNPCPPVVVGVGVGGNFEGCALLAKRALCRDTAVRNPDPLYASLEERMLEGINRTGIGPQGFGGRVTALAVNIEAGATHIASLPLAVNMGCHVTRHACRTI